MVSIFTVVMPSPVTIVNAIAHTVTLTEVIVCNSHSNESQSGGAGGKGSAGNAASEYNLTSGSYRSCRNLLTTPVTILAKQQTQVGALKMHDLVVSIKGEALVAANNSKVPVQGTNDKKGETKFYIMGPPNAQSYSVRRFIQ